MPGYIPESIIEEIQLRSDIVEVINTYIPLKKAGANFKAHCPFHNERTPSFTVSSSKQIFHCFGCGAGGNVFKFVMDYEHLNFVDAVKLLASKVGIAVPEKAENKAALGSKELYEINQFAADFYYKCLCDTKLPANNYFNNRNIKKEIVEKFKLGYAPSNGALLKEAKKKGIPINLLKKVGLVVENKNGISDMFRNRVMFPIFNAMGKVVGFSGRVLDDSLPKYINTPETQIFHKGKVLYGLNFSKTEILKQNYY